MPVKLSRVRTVQVAPAQSCYSQNMDVLNAMENGLRLMAKAGLSDQKTTTAVAQFDVVQPEGSDVLSFAAAH
jgi:hypothetical protein